MWMRKAEELGEDVGDLPIRLGLPSDEGEDEDSLDDDSEDSDDCMDADWMYPDGHDDGEYIGEMFEGDD